METITWHENMCDYFNDLVSRNINMGYRIDPTCVNKALMDNESELASLHGKYKDMLSLRRRRRQV